MTVDQSPRLREAVQACRAFSSRGTSHGQLECHCVFIQVHMYNTVDIKFICICIRSNVNPRDPLNVNLKKAFLEYDKDL